MLPYGPRCRFKSRFGETRFAWLQAGACTGHRAAAGSLCSTVPPSLLPGQDTWRWHEVSQKAGGGKAATARESEPVPRAVLSPAAVWGINGEISMPRSHLPKKIHHNVLTHQSQNVAE